MQNIAPLGFILARQRGWHLQGRVLHRRIKASKHVLRLPEPSVCFDLDLYSMLRPHIDSLEITDRESGMSYSVDAAVLDEHGVRCDFGHGVQVRLPLRFWRAERQLNTQLALGPEVAT